MASGDTVFSATSIPVGNADNQGSGNLLSFTTSPTADDGGFETWLRGSLNANYGVVLMVRVNYGQSGTHTAIGHPPFDAAKSYDVTIKEH